MRTLDDVPILHRVSSLENWNPRRSPVSTGIRRSNEPRKKRKISYYTYISCYNKTKQEKKGRKKQMSFESNSNESRSNPWTTMGNSYVKRDEKKKKKLMRQTIDDNFTFARNKFWHNPVNDSRVDASLPVNGADPLALGDVQGMFHSRQNIHFPCEPWLTHLLHSVRFSVWLEMYDSVCVRVCIFLFSAPSLSYEGVGRRVGPVSTINHNSVAFSF